MKTLRFPLLALLVGAAALASCDKDKEKKEDPRPAKTRPELLTSGTWQMTARTATTATGTTDLFAQMESYDKDDLYRYDKPDVYVVDEGATKQGSGPQQYVGTWSLTSNDAVLGVKLGSTNNTFNVMEVTETTLKISGVGTTSTGTSYTEVRTFAKK